jgi:hypothetical protein
MNIKVLVGPSLFEMAQARLESVSAAPTQLSDNLCFHWEGTSTPNHSSTRHTHSPLILSRALYQWMNQRIIHNKNNETMTDST